MLKPEFLAAGLAALLAVAVPAAHLLPSPAGAQEVAPGLTQVADSTRAAALADLMRMDQTFAIMAEEGRAHGADLEEGSFPGRGGAAWARTVEAIYDPAVMKTRFLAAFDAGLGGNPAALDRAEAFFGSDLGQRILTLELDARRAMIDKDVTEAAEVAAEKMQAARDPRLRLIRKMIEACDLVEMNVAGALTANLAFTQGLAETMPRDQAQPADEMMAAVWAQEAAVRSSTTTWLYSYLVMAYAPLSEDELQSYIDYWASPEGQALNAALFTAFDAVFVPLSQDLGRATGRAAQSSDI